MKKWPINTMSCEYEGCDRTNTTPCHYDIYKHDWTILAVLFTYGIKQAWRFWHNNWITVLDGYYCPEHAKEEGFCWCCGNFYVGASERFDFEFRGQWLCDGCWNGVLNEIELEEYDEWEEELDYG